MDVMQLLRDEWEWFTTARSKAARLDAARCRGCWTCIEVCPVGCFHPDPHQVRIVRMVGTDACVACGACVLQCTEAALRMSSRR